MPRTMIPRQPRWYVGFVPSPAQIIAVFYDIQQITTMFEGGGGSY